MDPPIAIAAKNKTRSFSGGSRKSVLSVVASLEGRSEHPIAEIIVEAADESAVNTDDVSAFESLTGKGVQADLNGETYVAGKPAFRGAGVSL